MSRGLHAKYELISKNGIILNYAYGGSNFSFPYDQDIFNSCDGRIEINKTIFDQSEIKPNDFFNGKVCIVKNCFYAELNIKGVDVFAIRTIYNIFKSYKYENVIPEKGMWVI